MTGFRGWGMRAGRFTALLGVLLGLGGSLRAAGPVAAPDSLTADTAPPALGARESLRESGIRPGDSAEFLLRRFPTPDSRVPASRAGARADSGRRTPAQFRVVSGGPVTVSAKLLPRRGKALTVGDQFWLELTVRHHRNTKSSEPFLRDSPAGPRSGVRIPGSGVGASDARAMDPFLVLDRKSTTRYSGDTLVDVHRLKMAAFATGDLKIPSFTVTWPADSEVLAAASDSIPLKVTSILPKDMKDVNDLKPQIQFPNLLPIWILLGVLAAAGLSYLGWRLYRRYRRIRLYGAPLPDPWDEALAALDAAAAKDWRSTGHIKRHYYTVSEILKRYLTRRFEFPAIDQTTTEIARELKTRKIAERDGFGDFFRGADMVKYAKYVPPLAEAEGVVPAARELVKTTTPKSEPGPTTRTSRAT